MFRSLIFTLFILFIGCEAKNRLVTLTSPSESFVIYGGKITDYPLLTVEVDCPDPICRVLLEFSISNPKTTLFHVFSQEGIYTYSHENVPPFLTLPGPISFLVDPNSDQEFVVSFRWWRGIVEEDWLPTELVSLNEEDSDIVRLDQDHRAITLALKRHDHPVLKIYAPEVQEGCTLHFFAGGLPSLEAIAHSKALLFKFDGSASFQNCFLKNEVVTAWIPDGCWARFIYKADRPVTLEVGDFKPSAGMFMSYEWDDPFGDSALYNESNEYDLLADETYPNRTIYLKVQVEPNDEGFLWLETFTVSGGRIWGINITSSTNQIYRANGQKLLAKWQPGRSEKPQGFSVYYWIMEQDDPSQITTTKTPETVTSNTEMTSIKETQSTSIRSTQTNLFETASTTATTINGTESTRRTSVSQRTSSRPPTTISTSKRNSLASTTTIKSTTKALMTSMQTTIDENTDSTDQTHPTISSKRPNESTVRPTSLISHSSSPPILTTTQASSMILNRSLGFFIAFILLIFIPFE